MLQTKYEVIITIDSQDYKIVFQPLNKKGIKELEEAKNKQLAGIKEADILVAKTRKDNQYLETVNEIIANNKDIIALGGVGTRDILQEQRGLLLEKKELEKRIREQKSQIEAQEENITSSLEDVEKLGELRFNLCISGKDVEDIKQYIKDGFFTYQQIITTAENAAREVSQKK